jgi:NedA-like, galactose-binding domain/PA14 domain
MPCSKSVPLSHFVSLITCKVPARRLRLVCLVILFAAVLSSLPAHLKRNGANAQSSRTRLTQGPPSHNLSNLDETYANAASGGPLKEYGRSGLLPPTAQSSSVVTVYPGANQTPDSTQPNTYLLFNTSNTGHEINPSMAFADENGWETVERTGRWFNFQAPSGTIGKITLKLNWEHYSQIDNVLPIGAWGGAQTVWRVEYTINGGSSWISLVDRGNWKNDNGSSVIPRESGEATVDIPIGTTFSQIQVRESLYSDASCSSEEGSGASSGGYVDSTISNIRLQVETVNCIASVPTDRWKGEYFNNQTLEGSPTMVRDDTDPAGFLNLNFGGGSPHPDCAPLADNFSARWTRTVNFAEGIYRFTAGVDNGVRLYIDGYLRIDQWGEFPPNTYRADAFLPAGNHEIKLEFIEYAGGASVSLSWTAVAAASNNMAFGKRASQSSTPLSNATADRAIDGNTSGNWADNSVNHTGYEHQPWWQVDLGSVQQIGTVILWNRTDCCSERLSNFYVLVSDNPFSSTDLTTTINQSGVSNYYTADPVGVAKEIEVYRSGRYVRVQLAGDNYLHLAEVEVRGMARRSLAFGKSVSQSSTAFGGDAFRAVDSNTNGNWYANSVTHTSYEHQPWWQVDLGSVQQIGAVILWNRTDVASERLNNFYVLVSDAPFNSTDLTATINQSGVSNYYTAGPVGVAKEIGVYRSGRYVRVQLAGDNYLHLAEVEVRSGASGSGCVASVSTDRWKGEYFNNTTLVGSPAMVRDDGASFLYFDFGSGAPSAACGPSPELFSARWTRTVNFAAGAYRFTVTGDDGVRLYIDGQLKVDKWFVQGATTYTANISLSAGPHEVKLEYFEFNGLGVAFLAWWKIPSNAIVNCP